MRIKYNYIAFIHYTMSKNIIICPHMHFDFSNGGIVVQYYLAKLLDELGFNVRIIVSDFNIHRNSYRNNNNNIFNKFWINDFPIDDNVIVIYCEGTIGNPLGAKNVVRWMLSELGKNVPVDWLHTWGKNELVYYFNSELRFNKTPEKKGSIFKLLNPIYINPLLKNINNNKRNGWCYTMRKSCYHKNLINLHPNDSYEITRQHTQDNCVEIFNKYEYFVSYDPLTFLSIMAPLCGCISIVHKVEGLTKYEWLSTLSVIDYMKYKCISDLYGIAYGLEEIEYAKTTIHLVEEQWKDIVQYNNSVKLFIDDIKMFDKMENTIKNNYY